VQPLLKLLQPVLQCVVYHKGAGQPLLQCVAVQCVAECCSSVTLCCVS